MMGTFKSKAQLRNNWHQKKLSLVETFIKAFKNESEKGGQFPKNENENENKIEALKDLNIRDDIVITKAYKGVAVAIIDVGDYINEANLQLNNKEFYKEILNDPTELNRKKAENAIKELKSARLPHKK